MCRFSERFLLSGFCLFVGLWPIIYGALVLFVGGLGGYVIIPIKVSTVSYQLSDVSRLMHEGMMSTKKKQNLFFSGATATATNHIQTLKNINKSLSVLNNFFVF